MIASTSACVKDLAGAAPSPLPPVVAGGVAAGVVPAVVAAVVVPVAALVCVAPPSVFLFASELLALFSLIAFFPLVGLGGIAHGRKGKAGGFGKVYDVDYSSGMTKNPNKSEVIKKLIEQKAGGLVEALKRAQTKPGWPGRAMGGFDMAKEGADYSARVEYRQAEDAPPCIETVTVYKRQD